MMRAGAAGWKMLSWMPVVQVVDLLAASVGSMVAGLCATNENLSRDS